MKKLHLFALFLLCASVTILSSCKKEEEDEGLLPNISFKSGGNYVSSSQTIEGDSTIVIGINASKAEPQDVLKKFNITKSVNGATGTSIYSADLSGAQGDAYNYDLSTTLGTTSGDTEKYTFTVTNRDGLVNALNLTITIQ